MSKISVIVPVYKAEKYIRRCIESILNQTLLDLELILVDDGSPDKSGRICDEYAAKDNRVKVIHKANGGAASARNVGISIATGEYIGFCDSDDYVNSNMYEDLICVMEQNNLDTISCLSNNRTENGTLLSEGNSDRKLELYSEVDYIKRIYSWKADVSLCTRVTKSEIVKQIRVPEKRRVEDFYFTILLMLKTKGTAIYNYPYYEYTVNSESVTHSANCNIYMDGMYFYEKTREILNNEIYAEEQEYYHFKMLYLLFVSLRKVEWDKYKLQIKYHRLLAKRKIFNILNNRNLNNKEKIVLLLAIVNPKLPSALYRLKNSGE